MEAKYLDLLDTQTLEFIRKTEEFYPADAVNATIGEQRGFYDALCTAYDFGYPEGVTATDRVISGQEADIPVRDYVLEGRAPSAHLLYFHGGGFVVGGLASHDSICAEFCSRSCCNVTAVDYRLSPEHIHPAAFEDSLAAWYDITNTIDLPILLAGDSAGGNLAAAIAHKVRGEARMPAGQLLIYPGLGGDMSKGSYQEHAYAPLLTLEDIQFYYQIRTGGGDVERDPTLAPLIDTDFSDLPPTVIISAQCDPLADDGKEYTEAITNLGGKATWINEQGMVHGYLRARYSVDRAAESFTRMVEAINMLAEGRWEE